MSEEHGDEINEAARQAQVTLEELAETLRRPFQDIEEAHRRTLDLANSLLAVAGLVNQSLEIGQKNSEAISTTAQAITALSARVGDLESRG